MFRGLMFDSIVLRVFPYVFSLSQHSRKLLNKRNSRDTNCEAEAMGPEDVGRGGGRTLVNQTSCHGLDSKPRP